MKKVLFIDRDGTIIMEPPVDYQVDSLEKLEFVPGVISALKSLRSLDFEIVMATNQDGLGTDSFPEEDFWPAHNKMLKTLEGEGVCFDDFIIDRTFPEENAPTRKPGTALFGKYMNGEYDLSSSYVIGDRVTDVELARNLGCKAILLAADDSSLKGSSAADSCVLATQEWEIVAEYIRLGERAVTLHRCTKETDILVELDLDRNGKENVIDTGLKFFDHMLTQIPHHGGISLSIKAKGDLEVDEHHTVEDTAIVLGEAIDKALGSKVGVARYGFALPMDECDALVLIDFGGRIDFEWEVKFEREMVGDVPTEMFKHFFHSLCCAAKCNLHISAKGENEHHKAEAIFKAFARALRMAVARSSFPYELPSSKGVL